MIVAGHRRMRLNLRPVKIVSDARTTSMRTLFGAGTDTAQVVKVHLTSPTGNNAEWRAPMVVLHS